VAGLGVGSAGKVGLLELTLARVDGRTRIVHQFQQTPLQILRAIYTDPRRPDIAFIYLLSPGGGVVQGDRLRIDLACEPGAAVHFTTQAATKLYRMEANFGTQMVNVSAGAGAFVEYLPDPVIPFRDSRFYQQTRLEIAPDATLIHGETLYPGRAGHDERHAYTLFSSRCEARRPHGDLLFADTVRLDASRGVMVSPGRLAGFDYLATLHVVTRAVAARDLAARLDDCLAPHGEVLAAASELPYACGAFVRLLGRTPQATAAAMHAAWNAARLSVIGAASPHLRKS
jgi:urease accessory protein